MWNQCGCSYAPIWFSKGLRITHAPHHTMSFCSYDVFLYQYIYIFLWTIPHSYIYICLSELPSSSFIIDFRYCQHIPQVCHLPITVALLKSFGHQYCSHLLTIVDISSLHSFCQILLLLACRMCSILCLAQSHYT